MRILVPGAVWALCFPAVAFAEPDPFFVGDGHAGARVVSTTNTVLNVYAAVTPQLDAGTASIPLTTTSSFAAGDLVMVLQSTGTSAVPASGTPGPFDLTGDSVGHYELVRVQTPGSSTLTLATPLTTTFPAGTTQVIRVPEYTDLTISAAATVVAPSWNGTTGGVIAFLATGTVSNLGAINANGVGFRGGTWVDATTVYGCGALDEAAPFGAQKGEGIAPTRFGAAQTGRGNVANGGGGGVCDNSGGGGGANGGKGGQGGRSYSAEPPTPSRDVGGMGGGALVFSLVDRLLLGGGGGAGQANNNNGSSGAPGGGLIWIRGNQLSGTGSITANGAGALPAVDDGAGGGGAGGSISLRFVQALAAGAVEANGGVGGNVSAPGVILGPGAGGGGGRILLQGTTVSVTPSTLAGLAGTQPVGSPFGTHYGGGPTATNDPDFVGVDEVPAGALTRLEAPRVTLPTDGANVASVRPSFAGTARAGAEVVLLLDGLPVGRVATTLAGDFTLTPSEDLAIGVHQLVTYAELQGLRSVDSAPLAFTVATAQRLRVGCSCGSAGSLWFALALLLFGRRRPAPG